MLFEHFKIAVAAGTATAATWSFDMQKMERKQPKMKRENRIVGPCVLCYIQLQWCCTADYVIFFLVWRDACKQRHKISHEAISQKLYLPYFRQVYIFVTRYRQFKGHKTHWHRHSESERHNTPTIRKVFSSTALNRWITMKKMSKIIQKNTHTPSNNSLYFHFCSVVSHFFPFSTVISIDQSIILLCFGCVFVLLLPSFDPIWFVRRIRLRGIRKRNFMLS